jgi:hypothetical protein
MPAEVVVAAEIDVDARCDVVGSRLALSPPPGLHEAATTNAATDEGVIHRRVASTTARPPAIM